MFFFSFVNKHRCFVEHKQSIAIDRRTSQSLLKYRYDETDEEEKNERKKAHEKKNISSVNRNRRHLLT